MMNEEHTWGWPIPGYLFLGGVGGGMMVVSAMAHLFFYGKGIFVLGDFISAVVIGLGSGLLVFDLGRPLYCWRVFSKERTILTFGAWTLSFSMMVTIGYGSCNLPLLPWYGVEWLHSALAWLCLLLGVTVVLYTGVFLGTMKARVLWSGPALPVLFLISGLSTGVAAQTLVLRFLPLKNSVNILTTVERFLRTVDIGLLILELIVVIVYISVMRTSSTVSAAKAAASWLCGNKAVPFWVGLVGIGLFCPVALYLVDNDIAYAMAPVVVLIGGLILRFLVVYSDNRIPLPGEEICYQIEETAGS